MNIVVVTRVYFFLILTILVGFLIYAVSQLNQPIFGGFALFGIIAILITLLPISGIVYLSFKNIRSKALKALFIIYLLFNFQRISSMILSPSLMGWFEANSFNYYMGILLPLLGIFEVVILYIIFRFLIWDNLKVKK